MSLATKMVLIGTVGSDHGTTPPPPVGLITTMTLLNTSGSTQLIGACTQMFGHPFKKGDIPAGQYPIFQTSDGTVIPYSISTKKKAWADGSLQHATFRLRLPVTIPGNSSLAINIYSGGGAPTPSSLTTAAFSAGGLDPNVFVTGQDNISGDWTSNLNQGIAAAWTDNTVYLDGDAGKSWEILAKFRQAGADHGQLEGWWVADALPNASGNLGGIRYFCRVVQPLYNVASPAPQYRSFTAFKTRNGTTQIRDLAVTLPAPKTFTWSGSGTVLNSTANGFESGIACKLSTTGTLPAGLNTTTLYCVATDPNNANVFGVAGNFYAPSIFACVTPANGGSGTHTATMYPMVSQFGSLWTAEADGRYSYIQGAGSIVSDSTILCQMNNVYWCQTKCLAPYALDIYNPASNPTYTYFPGTAGPVLRGMGTTGEREEIAQINSWYARHIFNQTAVDERAVRVIGLIGGHLPVALYDSLTRSIPVANNGTYSGMPAANSGFRWYASSNYSGFTPPSNTNVWTQGWSTIASDHMNGWAYYPYLLTGEPQFKRMLAEYGNLALYQGYTASGTAVVNGSVNTIGSIRNASIDGNNYSAVFYGEDGARTIAWGARDFGSPGIANFENDSYNTYFSDIRDDFFGGIAAYLGMLSASGPPYATAHGLFSEEAGDGLQSTFMLSYLIGTVAMITGINDDSAGRIFASYLTTWPAHVSNTFSPYLVCTYRTMVRQGAGSSPYAASDNTISMYKGNVSWDAATDHFTVTGLPSGATLNNGDIYNWNNTSSDGSPPPAGMTGWTPYYVVNKTGSGIGATFQLSATLGGSPIALSDSSGSALVFIRPSSPPSTGSIDTIIGSGYVASMVATCGWANAIGATVDATFLTDLTARLMGTAGYIAAFEADPKYAIGSTYV